MSPTRARTSGFFSTLIASACSEGDAHPARTTRARASFFTGSRVYTVWSLARSAIQGDTPAPGGLPVSFVRAHAAHLLVLVALVAAGCPSTPTAPEPQKVSPPKVAASVRYQLGGPLRGPVAPGSVPSRDAEKPGKTLALTARVVALAAPPTGYDLALVSSQARLVVFQDDSGSALHATPHALVDARAGIVNGTADKVALALEQDARGRSIALLRGCVVSGATTAIDVLRDEPPALGEPSRRERATVLLGRPADGKEVDAAIEVELGAAPELVLLAGPIYPQKGEMSLLAVVPSPFQGEEAGWLAFC